MDSWPIAQELERRYPSPSLYLDEPVTVKIRDQISRILSPIVLQLLPRVPDQLPERSQEYYNRTREEMLGRPLAEVHKEALENAEDSWKQLQEPVKEVADLLRKNDGPFFLGDTGMESSYAACEAETDWTVSYADFILVSMLYFVKRFDEQAYRRLISFDPAFPKVYEAAKQWFTRAT
jgi:glutathione S-transferase